MSSILRSISVRLSLCLITIPLLFLGAKVAFSDRGDDDHGFDKVQLDRDIGKLPDAIDLDEIAARAARFDADRELAHANYVQWLADFNQSGNDPRTLNLVEEEVDFAPPPADIDAALRAAALIVVAKANRVEFRPSEHDVGEAVVTLAVESVVRGKGVVPRIGLEITVSFGGGPQPVPESLGEPHNAVLGYLAGRTADAAR